MGCNEMAEQTRTIRRRIVPTSLDPDLSIDKVGRGQETIRAPRFVASINMHRRPYVLVKGN